jgi:hypothetical protein
MRKSGIASLLLAASLGFAPALIGCDKEVSHTEKTTTDPNGNKSTSESKTVQHSDGSVTTEKHSDAERNPSNTVTTEKKVEVQHNP